ncbi:uncharacterized protein L969DRAFT_218938 [Mixia osmundae IAM 14324]|uniref:Uncharacterized protein n=1 Tax=Mixia osmundae (strain CBS 9802 / IAM 14324 / JCM 22182 / KY 12970) TaxID=764103 RepID=G7DZJ5_MIXOS|nr:uncharacterized protein L969DRAFT_218938 [Mixia osmundae IAM 14324]KEI37177.1 hypothetical protein L969DRAFT_218938 [Mixia osmundae IAM 14324]GAA96005.1 hypothetical protein E5Q_02665 [Mixia osmundae IAM 14324]
MADSVTVQDLKDRLADLEALAAVPNISRQGKVTTIFRMPSVPQVLNTLAPPAFQTLEDLLPTSRRAYSDKLRAAFPADIMQRLRSFDVELDPTMRLANITRLNPELASSDEWVTSELAEMMQQHIARTDGYLNLASLLKKAHLVRYRFAQLSSFILSHPWTSFDNESDVYELWRKLTFSQLIDMLPLNKLGFTLPSWTHKFIKRKTSDYLHITHLALANFNEAFVRDETDICSQLEHVAAWIHAAHLDSPDGRIRCLHLGCPFRSNRSRQLGLCSWHDTLDARLQLGVGVRPRIL